MGAVYPYMVLKLGFGPNVSIVLAFSIMFVGAAIRATWLARHPASAARYMIAVASGFIAGEALVAVIAPLLIALGIGLASR
ncbi:MAG: OPT/YSL family transporter [Caulobacteraceae bacterium]